MRDGAQKLSLVREAPPCPRRLGGLFARRGYALNPLHLCSLLCLSRPRYNTSCQSSQAAAPSPLVQSMPRIMNSIQCARVSAEQASHISSGSSDFPGSPDDASRFPPSPIHVTRSPLAAPKADYTPPAEQAEEDLHWMREALIMANEAFDAQEVPIGSIFVRQGKVIARARNRTNELMNVSVRRGGQITSVRNGGVRCWRGRRSVRMRSLAHPHETVPRRPRGTPSWRLSTTSSPSIPLPRLLSRRILTDRLLTIRSKRRRCT